MKKHLILVLALALVAGLTVGAYAEVQNVKVSGDITVLGLSRNLWITSHPAENTFASIMRLRVDADLTDNVIATVRLINERYWGRSGDSTTQEAMINGNNESNTNITLDLAYVTLKEFLYSPLTLTIGRQELHFGNDMIVGDAYTNNHASKDSVFNSTIDADLSMRKSFDAIRATLNYDPLVIDVVAAQLRKNYNVLETGTNNVLSKDNQEILVGINANYAVSKTTAVEGYFWQRNLGKQHAIGAAGSGVSAPNKQDITNVVGARIITKPLDMLTWQLEGAYQFGNDTLVTNPTTGTISARSQGLKREAFAIETAATYDMRNYKTIGKYVPTVTALYAYFSGDRGSGSGGKTNSAWDPMYENQKFGDIANALFNQTNAHIAGGIITMKPVDDVMLKGEYYAYWWDKRFVNGGSAIALATGEVATMTGKKFAGQEIDLSATYDYTEDVQFGILGGMLFPGNSFAKDNNRNMAGEVIGSMKVTF
ncbi:MAG: alginate export family protein [Candidatus Omnitrophota bacterium]|jgi:hypothetical protein